MPKVPPTPELILTALADTPKRLAALVAGLAPAHLRTAQSPGEWSANDTLAHLRACADMWGGCIERIIAEDAPVLRAVNPTSWISQTDYHDLQFLASLRAFEKQRARLLALLMPLPLDGWSRIATVTGAGKPLVRTVMSYAGWMARHERPHIKQIKRIVDAMRT